MSTLDPERFRLPGAPSLQPPTRPRTRFPAGVKFLKGPVPWAWLARAMALPGKAVHVGLVLWLEAGLRRSHNVAVSLSSMASLGVKRSAASRALAALETAGLISVVRASGRKPRVTINEGEQPIADSEPCTT